MERGIHTTIVGRMSLGLPLPPSNVSVTVLTQSSVALKWTSGNTEPVQSYIIQYRRKYSPEMYIDIWNVSNAPYTLSSLAANTVYEFRVIAVNHVGQSLPSFSVNVTTPRNQGIVINFLLNETESIKATHLDGIRVYSCYIY